MKYQISGIRKRTDYSFALKVIHDEVDDMKEIDDEEFQERKRRQVKLEYSSENGILDFATNVQINLLRLNMRLAEKGLGLKVLK